MYRNSIDVISIEGIHVDEGSLWKLQDNLLVLEDDDQFVTHDLTKDFTLDE
ncbi:hypothetical protein ACFS5M_14125 [Lacinutrix iliipiscaria]|uniref:Uncharacterized protein n=1 Tax=Lacinutrix iliipiscaria TaxID=1230532 RepID=A0ABW5WU42_9FLAO